MTSRQMALVAFMQAGSTSVYAGSWRHPATEHGYLDASYYAKIGRQLDMHGSHITNLPSKPPQSNFPLEPVGMV